MTLTKKILSLSGAAAVAVSALATPTAVQAETSASMSFSNMYLWRGQNISPDGAVITGDLSYSHESGLHAGAWTSSENGGTETDLTVGYGGEAGGVSYDVTYWFLLYPEERDNTGAQIDLGDSDHAELSLTLGFQGFTFEYYMGVDSDNDDNNYLALSYNFGKYGITYGMWDLENGSIDSGVDAGQDEYTHLTLSYAATDDLTFKVNKAMSDLDTDDRKSVEEDLLFQVMYSKSFDMMAK